MAVGRPRTRGVEVGGNRTERVGLFVADGGGEARVTYYLGLLFVHSPLVSGP